MGETQTPDWESTLVNIFDELVASGQVPLTLESESGRQRRATIRVGDDSARLTEPNMLFEGLGFKPWQPPAVIAELTPEGAAQREGLIIGDRITSIDGEAIQTYSDLIAVVSARPDKLVSLAYVRDNREYVIDVPLGNQQVDGETRGLLGVRGSNDFGEFAYLRKFGPLESLSKGAERTWTSTLFTLRMLGRMVTGEVSIKNISGPINIAQFAGELCVNAGLNPNFSTFLAHW